MNRKNSLLRSAAALALFAAPLLSACSNMPSDPFAAAQQSLAAGEPKTALLYVSKAIETDPDAEEFRMLAGEIALALNNPDRAITEFKRIGATSPLASKAKECLAEAYLAKGNLRLAKQTAEGLVLDNPQAFRVAIALDYAEGDYAAGQSKLKTALSQYPDDGRLITIDAERLYGEGKPDAALKRIAGLLEKEPAMPEAQMLAGQIRLAQRSYDQAVGHFEKTIAVRPGNQTAMLALAAIARDRSDDEAAKKWINAVNNAGPAHPVALYFTAQMAFDAGELERTHELLQIMPRGMKSAAHIQRLEGLVASARGNPKTAIGALERYFSRSEGDLIARRVLAENYAKNDEWDNAWRTIAPLVDHPQADGPGLALALQIAEKTGRSDASRIKAKADTIKARAAMAKPLQEAGAAIRAGKWEDADGILSRLANGAGANDVVVLNNAAAVKAKLGKHAEAVTLARKAHTMAPQSPEVMDTLGWALWQSGSNPAEARELLNKARELAPGSREIAEHWAVAHADN